jgi:hypothetical protein
LTTHRVPEKLQFITHVIPFPTVSTQPSIS